MLCHFFCIIVKKYNTMSKKKRFLKKTRHTKTYDTETGPITEMEGATVTPEGNGIGYHQILQN